MALQTHPNANIEYWLQRERTERARASAANDTAIRDSHLGLAERCADRAWQIAEQSEGAYLTSGLWPRRLIEI